LLIMKRVVAFAAFVIILAGADHAQAQSIRMGTFRGFLTGHVGLAAGGELSDPRLTAGGSVSVQEQDGWGAELDFGRADDALASGQELDITTYMVNGSWVRPTGHFRPFGVLGGGLMQIHGCGATCSTSQTTYDLGFTLGAGVIALVNDAFGVRGDARYLFTSADHPELNRPERFGFWRFSIGATFSWAIVP
jgi:opacity protein-like surface antigen